MVAKLVWEKIDKKEKKINKKEFYKGCILPDIINSEDSHYKIKGKNYLIPDIEKYKKNNKMDKDINKGYLCHLLLDKYFLEEYVIDNVPDYDKVQLFSPELMYNDYTNMNALLVKKYKLDIKYINEIMENYEEELDGDKYKLNVDSINYKIVGELQFIDFEKFCSFLEEVADIIYDILNKNI